MIQETFIALKGIGVQDEHILQVVVAQEQRHQEFRQLVQDLREDYNRDIHEIKREMAVVKWMFGTILVLTILVLGLQLRG